MRRRYRYDADLDCLVEIGGNYFEERTESGPAVISDDLGAGVNGLKHMPSGKMLDSKSAHRAETKARGLEEVGTSTDFASKREKPGAEYYTREVIDAQQQIAGNWNGTADWLRRQNEGRKD